MEGMGGFGPPVYVGKTLNAREQARFDFPESSYEGQPIGIPRAGSQANHQHNVLTNVEPTYVASPTQTAIASSPIAMPKITQVSPQRDSVDATRKRDQGQYLNELQMTMMKKQQEIALTEERQREYMQRAGENLFRNAPVGQKTSPQVSPERLAEAAKKQKSQQAFADEITRLQNAKPIPQGHHILLHQQRPISPQYQQYASEQTRILYGKGEMPEPDPSNKLELQKQYRASIDAANALQAEPSPERKPRIRPDSPSAPIPGQNFLSTIGEKDSPAYKLKKLQEAKELIQQQAQIATLRENMKKEAERPLTEIKRPGGGTPLKKKQDVPERGPHFPSPKVASALATQQMRNEELNGGAEDGSTVTEENYMRRKAEQTKYRDALNSDKRKPRPDEALGISARISVKELPAKGANTRQENNLRSAINEIVKGPNVVDTIGNYDYDRHDYNKKLQRQLEYSRQLQEAQANSLPLSETLPREALMPRLRQKNELTPDPFHHGDVYLGSGHQPPPDTNNSLPGLIDKEPYQGYSREGGLQLALNLSDDAVRQMKDEKRAKQQEFIGQVQQATAQSPIKSPRVSNYRHKYPLDDLQDGSTPYEITADQLAHNEKLLEETIGQNTELQRQLEEQMQQAAEAGVDREHARELLIRRMAHEQYVLQLEEDARRKRIEASRAPDRLSLAAYKPGGSRGRPVEDPRAGAEHEEANGYGSGGLPMFNPYDWNEQSLDYHWNSDQSTHYPGSNRGGDGLTDSARHRLPHGTHQMHYGERDGKPPGSPRSFHPGTEEHFQQQAAYATAHAAPVQRMQMMQENKPKNTSLPLYQATPHAVEEGARQLHFDKGNALLMKNQDLYAQGLLTDRTAKEHERQMAKYVAQVKAAEASMTGTGQGQGSYYRKSQAHPEDFFVPNLTISKPLPKQELALSASRSNPQIVASLTQGRTPHARPQPPLGDPLRSPASFSRGGLTTVGNANTIERNSRQGYTNPTQRTQVYQAGFPAPR